MGSARLEDLLGDSSSYTAMTDREKDYFVKLLQEEMHRREDSGRVEQIRDIVRIEDWINSDYYVGSDQKSIYPYWKDFIVDIFRDTRKDDEKINSVILSGSIGIGKSTVAELIMMRKMYELSCFRNINAMFNLIRITTYQIMVMGCE